MSIERCQADVVLGDDSHAPGHVVYCKAHAGHTGAHIGYPLVMWYMDAGRPMPPEEYYKTHKA